MDDLLFSVFHQEMFVDLNLYQCGYQKCSSLHSYGPFIRNHYLFHYVISGRGYLSYRDDSGVEHQQTIEAGQGFLICPKQMTTYWADEHNPWEYTWVEFDGLKAKESLELAGLGINSPLYTSSNAELTNLLKEELLAIARNPKASSFYSIGHFYLFLDCLTRSSCLSMKKTPTLSDLYIQQAISFIEQNYQNDISVQDIADYCTLNRSYFGKIFHKKIGKSPQQFLIEYRMAKAAELLKLTNLPIKDISASVGYPNQLHFSRAFKSVYQLSPSHWRTLSLQTP